MYRDKRDKASVNKADGCSAGACCAGEARELDTEVHEHSREFHRIQRCLVEDAVEDVRVSREFRCRKMVGDPLSLRFISGESFFALRRLRGWSARRPRLLLGWALGIAAAAALASALVHGGRLAPHARLNPAADFIHWLSLLALALVALLLLRLPARLRARAREAESWRGQARDLHQFIRRALEMNLHLEPGPQLAELIHEIFALEAVAVFDAELRQVYPSGDWKTDPRELAQSAYTFSTSDDDPKTGLSRRVVRLGAAPIGSLVARGNLSPLTVNAIAALMALAFDRYRAFANESRMETERRAEQLRSTVLDSLAHAYKTPLTAIRAASSGLSEMGHLSPAQAELVALIEEQAGLLGDLTTRLLTTARLDATEVRIHATPVGVAPLMEEVVASLGDRLASRKVAIDISDEHLVVDCDRQLVVMLLTQYIDNACKYSIFGSTITIGAARSRAEVIFWVRSLGPVIPIHDRERIFDRYYRSVTCPSRAAGTGIGLSVAKRVALLHGGSVWVTSDETEGNTFFAAIPAVARKRVS